MTLGGSISIKLVLYRYFDGIENDIMTIQYPTDLTYFAHDVHSTISKRRHDAFDRKQ